MLKDTEYSVILALSFSPFFIWKSFCPVMNSPRHRDFIDILFVLSIHHLKVILIRQVLNSQIDNNSEQKGENKIFPDLYV